jgi:hypothetical protein
MKMKKIILGIGLTILSTNLMAQRYIMETHIDPDFRLYETSNADKADCVLAAGSYVETFNENEADNTIQWVSSWDQADLAVYIVDEYENSYNRCSFLSGGQWDITDEYSQALQELIDDRPHSLKDYARLDDIKDYWSNNLDWFTEYPYSAEKNSVRVIERLQVLSERIKSRFDKKCRDMYQNSDSFSSIRDTKIVMDRRRYNGSNLIKMSFQPFCYVKKSNLEIPEQSFRVKKRKLPNLFKKTKTCELQIEHYKEEEGRNRDMILLKIMDRESGSEKYDHRRFSVDSLKTSIIESNRACESGNCEFKVSDFNSDLEGRVVNGQVKISFARYERDVRVNVDIFEYINSLGTAPKYKTITRKCLNE